ncbi:MAG: hypothetical protein AB7E52_08160 [Bdellovibrionales bacterium]
MADTCLHTDDFVQRFRTDMAGLLRTRGQKEQAERWALAAERTGQEKPPSFIDTIRQALRWDSQSPSLDLVEDIMSMPNPLYGTKESNPHGNLKIALHLCARALTPSLNDQHSYTQEAKASAIIVRLCKTPEGKKLLAKSRYFSRLYERADYF